MKKIYKDTFASVCNKIKIIRIPNSVKYIEKESFKDFKELEVVILSDNVEKIEESTFYGCEKLSYVRMPEKLKVIEDSAFFDCHSLEDIDLCDVIEIGNEAFGFCYNLTEIEIPFSTGKIGNYVFEGCNLASIDTYCNDNFFLLTESYLRNTNLLYMILHYCVIHLLKIIFTMIFLLVLIILKMKLFLIVYILKASRYRKPLLQ